MATIMKPGPLADMRPPMRRKLQQAALNGHCCVTTHADSTLPVWRSVCFDCREVVVQWSLGSEPRLMEAAKVQCRG